MGSFGVVPLFYSMSDINQHSQ